MEKQVLIGLLLTVVSAPAAAAPGEVVKRWNLACGQALIGLAFDGKTLYYTVDSPIPPGHIYKADAATGADRGSIVVTIKGVPSSMLGLEYDANRNMLWGGGGRRFYLVPIGGGEVVRDLYSLHTSLIAVTYDAWQDHIWDSDGSRDLACWDAEDNGCFGMASYDDYGVTFDGVDVWHQIAESLPPPFPSGGGHLAPSDWAGNIDHSRLIDLPGVNYGDIAFDCVTFPVPVIWVGSKSICEVIAYEVDTRAPCLPPGDRIARTWIPSGESRGAWLPPVVSTAQRVVRAPSPFLYTDAGAIFNWNLYYRVLGPLGEPRGNVLRAVKDVVSASVVLSN